MTNRIKGRTSYLPDLAAVRRLKEALALDSQMDEKMRNAMIISCHMVIVTILAMDADPKAASAQTLFLQEKKRLDELFTP